MSLTSPPPEHQPKVIVLIIPGDASVKRTNVIKRLFSNPMFDVITCEPRTNIQVVNDGCTPEQTFEAHCVSYALTVAMSMDSNAPCIIIKDTSTSASSPDVVAATVRRCLSVPNFDLCYLCKWLDMCQLYIDATNNDSSKNEISIMRTKSPNGVQAILFTPRGRDVVLGTQVMSNGRRFCIECNLSKSLNKDIYDCNISAICTVPNLIEYDIALNSTSNSDFLKANECQPVSLPQENVQNNEGNIVGFVILAFLTIMVAWAFLRCGTRR